MRGSYLKRRSIPALLAICVGLANAVAVTPRPAARDPLPSWNDGPAKSDIVAFVRKVTKTGSPDYVTAPERIATFDNDGTLWSEQPIYFQFAFVLDRVKALAPEHPEWKTQQPFKAVIENDMRRSERQAKRASSK